jgi:zinc protease
MSTRPLPPLGPTPRLKLPPRAERTLANGLTVIAVRRPGVPLVELRLMVPLGRAHLARTTLLSQTLLSGTADMSNVEIAAQLQAIGGGLTAGSDADRLMISGNSLVTGLDRLLGILAEVLTGATYPGDEVANERERLIDRIRLSRSQPAHQARTALLKRIYGRHPYADQTPEPTAVRAVRPGQLRSLHDQLIQPTGGLLALVGDLRPERALDAVEAALGGWPGGKEPGALPPTPELRPSPLLLVDRPEAVQSSMRMALPAVPRSHPDHAALQLVNLVFGGYFSARWVENIREDKGYTYGARSAVEHSAAGSVLTLTADVATEVTAPALLETRYELGRLATLPPSQEEVDQARRYALGSLQLGMATQAGLAGLISAYAGSGLRLEYLAEYATRLSRLTRDEVAAAAATYLAPAKAVAVILGDAERIAAPLAALTELEVEPAA